MNLMSKEISVPQVWLITGSSRGLGRTLAKAILAAGHKLVAARNPAQVAGLVRRCGDQVRAVQIDVSDERAASDPIKNAALGKMFNGIRTNQKSKNQHEQSCKKA